MAREKLDHAVPIGVANGGRRVDDDRARRLHCREPVQNDAALAHGENIRIGRVGQIFGFHQFDDETLRRQRRGDALHDRSVVANAAGRVRLFPIDAPTSPARGHSAMLSRSTHGAAFRSLDVLRTVDVIDERQGDAIDRRLFAQPFQIVAQAERNPTAARRAAMPAASRVPP